MPRASPANARAWERFEAGWKLYEPLPQTGPEAALWQAFVPEARAWRVPAKSVKPQGDPAGRRRVQEAEVIPEEEHQLG